MIAFLKLIRLPNLLIIALTQYLIRIFLDFSSFPAIHFPDFNFFLLSLSTVMIAAAGYIINDYFDIKADLINKPNEVIVGNTIKRRTAMAAHIVINVTAIALGSYVFWKSGNLSFATIHIVAAGLLWYYAVTYKKQFLVGNLVISLLTALVILIVGIYEKQIVTQIALSYSWFAFSLTLIREIVKDMEDIEGDLEIDCKSLPIVLGMAKTKVIVSVIVAMVIISLAFFQYYLMQNNAVWHLLYITFLIQLPLFSVFWFIYKANSPGNYHKISQLLKVIMITGVFTIVIFYFI